MRKIHKFLVGCVLMAVIGIIIAGIGFAMGGRVRGVQLDADGLHVSADALMEKDQLIREEETMAAFDSISIDTEYADITLEPSDDGQYAVSYCVEDDNDYRCEIEDGQLVITQGNKDTFLKNVYFFSLGSSIEDSVKDLGVTVYVPKDAVLSDISLIADTGDITCGKIQADNLTLEADYGDVRLEDMQVRQMAVTMESGEAILKQVQGESLQIENDYGNITLDRVELAQAMKATIESGDIRFQDTKMGDLILDSAYGKVTGQHMELKRLQADMESSDCRLQDIILDSCQIQSEYGDVEIGSARPLEDHDYDLDVEYGEIFIDGQKEHGSFRSLGAKDTDHMIKIQVESGDIKLSGLGS